MNNNFRELTRAYTLPMSITPFLVAFACANEALLFRDYSFIANAALILIGVVLVHLSANLFDDYIDVQNKLNEGLKLNEINFKSARKAKALLNGAYSMKQARQILLIMLIIAFLIGIYFTFLRGGSIFLYMAITAILAGFYPVSSKYGLSEIVVGVVFGPVLINASYCALCGQYDSQVFNFSIASGIMTTILLIAHSLMDYEYDINSGKNTLPVLLKNKNLTVNFISLLILISYFILIFTSVKYGFNKMFIVIPIVLSLPVATKLVLSLYDYIDMKDVEFIPKWYLGPMENWDEINKINFAFFMYRFYLARNLAAIFNIMLAFSCAYAFLPVGRTLFEF